VVKKAIYAQRAKLDSYLGFGSICQNLSLAGTPQFLLQGLRVQRSLT